MRAHLRPTAAIAPDALLPGDPKWAMELARRLVDRPLVSNLSRGLWGYHGRTGSGRELTVQSTGIGGPSAAVVLEELARHGVRRAIRLGTCTALDAELEPGSALVAGAALPRGAPEGEARPDPGLTRALVEATGAPARTVVSTDLYYDPDEAARHEAWRDTGAVAVELSAATLFAVGERLGVRVGCGLVVAAGPGGALDDEPLEAASMRLGEAAARALDAVVQAEPGSP